MTRPVSTEPRAGRILRRTWYSVLAGLLVGVAVWFGTALTTDQEPPEVPLAGSGRVVGKLGAPCALVDEALLGRLYGAGSARASDTSGTGDTECAWSAAPTSVKVEADLADYPEGDEAGGAEAGFDADLASAEEADPVGGLPEQVSGLGDEAYVVYDPGTGRRRGGEESAVVTVRRGNVVVIVTVRRARGSSVVGHDRMVDEARQVAAAAVARLP